VLGRFEAQWSDGEPVDFVSKKAQALLAYLAVESERATTCARHYPRSGLAAIRWSLPVANPWRSIRKVARRMSSNSNVSPKAKNRMSYGIASSSIVATYLTV
jgi:hypothetical protein